MHLQATGKLDLKEPIYRQLSAWYPPQSPEQGGEYGSTAEGDAAAAYHDPAHFAEAGPHGQGPNGYAGVPQQFESPASPAVMAAAAEGPGMSHAWNGAAGLGGASVNGPEAVDGREKVWDQQ